MYGVNKRKYRFKNAESVDHANAKVTHVAATNPEREMRQSESGSPESIDDTDENTHAITEQP